MTNVFGASTMKLGVVGYLGRTGDVALKICFGSEKSINRDHRLSNGSRLRSGDTSRFP